MVTPLEAAEALAQEYGILRRNGYKSEAFEPASFAKATLDGGLIVAKGGGRIFVYDQGAGTYIPGEEKLRSMLARRLGADWRPARADAVARYLYDTAPRLWDRPPMDRVNVQNGILDIHSEELHPHSPDFLTSVQINAEWHHEAVCPLIDRFIQEVIPTDIAALPYELGGLLTVPDARKEQAFLLIGTGENGKSVLLKLYGHLLGKSNVSHQSLQDLTADRFSAAELFGKLANICADLPNQMVKYTGLFKRITSGDGLTLQRKYGHPFDAVLYARLIFSANEIPSSRDTTYSYVRRWTVVPFPNRFSDDKRDEDLIEKLTAPDEIRGFLVRCIRAYRVMLERKAFTSGPSAREAKRRFQEDIDPVLTFIRAVTNTGEDRQVGQTPLYRHYKCWMEQQDMRPKSAKSFNSTLQQHLPVLVKKTVNGRPTWEGIDVLS